MTSRNLKAISLFSGMGGDTLGMKLAGVDVIAYSEKEEYIRKTHETNFKNCKLIGNGDITKTTDDEFMEFKDIVNIIFAGFPCQGFSQAGKKLPNDPRNTLFKEFVRAAKLIEPDIIIGENVKGLLSKKTFDGHNYIDVIVSEFEKLNYNVMYDVFKCENFNIPQKRERLIIIGIKKNKLNEYKFCFPDKNEKSRNLVNIIDKTNYDNCVKVEKTIFDFSLINGGMIIIPNDIPIIENPHPYLNAKINPTIDQRTYSGKTYNSLLSYEKRDSPLHCEIVNFTKPSKTIICTYEHQPRLFVPLAKINEDKEIIEQYLRCLTPYELKQIQTFPKKYIVCGSVKQQIIQIGNAVPPLLIYKIVKQLLN